MRLARPFPRTLAQVSSRYLLRRPWPTALMIIGIMLGVAVAVAIDLANVSASRSFDLSVETMTGRATHHIIGGPQGVEETLYTDLKLSGTASLAAPIVLDYVTSPQIGNRLLQLMGVDLFAEPPFRSYLTDARRPNAQPDPDVVIALLTKRGALVLSTDLAARYDLQVGQAITVTVGGYPRTAFIAGLVAPPDNLSRRALDGLILADIATAQELTGRIGRLDRIDLILPTHREDEAQAIRQQLPPGVSLIPTESRSNALEQMTSAFRINLTALSLLALVVGMFLIYNSITFSVVKRRPLFGTLRCLGVTRAEVFVLVIGEAALVGVVGSVLGVGLGIVMGRGAVQMVSQTINDLYFASTVTNVGIPLTPLVKGGLLGILAAALAAAPPAWEAASVPPTTALSRSGLEGKARSAVLTAAGGGILALIIGTAILLAPTRDLTVSFVGTFCVILGAAMLTPAATVILMKALAPVFGRLAGALGRMGPRGVSSSLSRTSVAIAALMVAVSVTIGVSVMIGSFRNTVVEWLAQTLHGDIYIAAYTTPAAQTATPLDPALVAAIRRWPGVERVDTLRAAVVDSPEGPISVAAVDNPNYGSERIYVSADLPPERIWAAMLDDKVIISEPLANRLDIPRHGGSITLATTQGLHTFPVVGVYYDYTSSQGAVSMSAETYRRWWGDEAVTALSLRLSSKANADETARSLEEALAPIQSVFIRPNRVLRQDVMVIFDRTFAITGALQLLATVVAFIGVLNAMLAVQLDKQREFGVLRAVGLTAQQLWRLLLLETGLMGVVAGFLSMPTGLALSVILIYIINRRSFGWTLQMQVSGWPFVNALLIATTAALLAGLYPAFRLGKMSPIEALRRE